MEQKPFISIIIPVRNFERTIEKAFEYLLNVDYPHNCWEWVIADGGSSDKTVEIIKNWQNKYPFIKLVEIPNCPSPGFARNKALEVVKGDFLFFGGFTVSFLFKEGSRISAAETASRRSFTSDLLRSTEKSFSSAPKLLRRSSCR